MEKRRKKVDEKTRAEIIRLSKDYGINYIARHLELDESTVRRHLKRETERRVMASSEFRKHRDDLGRSLKALIASKRSELLYCSLMHFRQRFPEFAHINEWQDITAEDIANGILDKMELLADSRTFHFCAKCPICQAIKRQLKA